MIKYHSHKEKQQIFNSFLSVWKDKFSKVYYILHYLQTYPEIADRLEIGEFLRPENLISSQLEWLWLYSKFEGMEKEFFKPYWVPVQSNSYEYFIDLSSKTYSIIGSYFFSHKATLYYKTFLFEDIAELMLADDNQINLEQLIKEEFFELLHFEENL